MSDLANQIKRLMQDQDITQNELSELCGVSQVTISKILSGATRRSRHLNEIANILGTTADALLGKEEMNEAKEKKWQKLRNIVAQLSDDEVTDLTTFARNQLKNRVLKDKYNIS